MDNPEQNPMPIPASNELGEGASLLAAEGAFVQPAVQGFPPWKGWDVLAVAGSAVALVFLCSVLAVGVARLVTAGRHVPVSELATNPLVLIGAQIVAYPIVLFFMIMVVGSRSDEGFWQAMRWNWTAARAPLFFIGGVMVAIVVNFASEFLPVPKSTPMDNYFQQTVGAYVTAAFGVTLAPLLEELFFRGMLYPTMRRLIGVVPGVLFTATMFAAIHGAQLSYAWAPLLSIFVVGIIFTVVREKTGSVAASFVMHVGYNLALFGAMWIASDHFRHLEKVVG
jgi:membrane protease YdiL (CAAX protease family)